MGSSAAAAVTDKARVRAEIETISERMTKRKTEVETLSAVPWMTKVSGGVVRDLVNAGIYT